MTEAELAIAALALRQTLLEVVLLAYLPLTVGALGLWDLLGRRRDRRRWARRS